MTLDQPAIKCLVEEGWECDHGECDRPWHPFMFESDDEPDINSGDYDPPDIDFSGNAIRLTIGEVMMTPSRSKNLIPGLASQSQSAQDDMFVPIEPGEFLYFVTKERFRLPPYVDAELFSRPQVANRGLLFFTLGHISPGFSGALTGTLLNMTDDTLYIKRSEPLLYMMCSWATSHPEASFDKLQDREYNEDEHYYRRHAKPSDTLLEAREATGSHPEPGFALTSDNFVTRGELYSALAVILSIILLIVAITRFFGGGA